MLFKYIMFLPDEIINLILSYREVNPVALLIRESINVYNDTPRCDKLHCYYFHILLNYQKEMVMKKCKIFEDERKKKCDEYNKKNDEMEKDRLRIKNEIDKIDISMFSNYEKSCFAIEVGNGFNKIKNEIDDLRREFYKNNNLLWNKINELRRGVEYFIQNTNHSIICSNTINSGYKYKENWCSEEKWYNPKSYFNKYRNEIYNKSIRNNRINYKKSKNIQLYYSHLLEEKIYKGQSSFVNSID